MPTDIYTRCNVNGDKIESAHLLASILRLVEVRFVIGRTYDVLRSARWIAVYKLRDTETCVQRWVSLNLKNAIWNPDTDHVHAISPRNDDVGHVFIRDVILLWR